MPTKSTTSRTLNISQAQELKILRSIVELTNSDIDLTAVLKDVVKLMTESTKADSVFIYLFDEKREHLVLYASKTPHKKELGKLYLNVGEGIAGWVAEHNELVAISKNAYKDGRFKNMEELPEDKYEALLSTPVVYKNKVIGVINIQHKKSHEYPTRTVNVISTIAKQISGVIRTARLYDETKQKALQFDSLIKVSESITSEDYLDEILNLIVVVTAEMLNSKICSIMMIDPKKNELLIKATQSLSEDYKRKPNVKIESSLLGQVIKTGKPLTIQDVRKEEHYTYRDLAVREDLTSMLAVPMTVKNTVIGVITVYMKKPHKFTQEEIDMLQIVANQAAVAIENTKLVDEAVKAKEALEARKIVEKAKGIIMRMNNLTEDAAHKLIHKKSMDSCKTMKEISESIILMDELNVSR